MKNRLLILGFLAILLIALPSCASNPPKPYDFMASFSSAKITPDGMNFATPDGRPAFILKGVTVGNVKRDAIITLADAKLEFDIPEVPTSSTLKFAAGMGVDRGDGAQGQITVQADRKPTIVYQKFINPIDKAEDRHWFDESVDMSKFAGKHVQITFSTSAGPRGDAIADWFAWASPRLQ